MESWMYMSILVGCMGIISANSVVDHVARVGNEISKPSLSGVDVPATFLQRDIVLKGGIVFAYAAYFRSEMPVWFQIWRPVSTSGGRTATYTLVAQTRVLPAVVGGREDIYIESRLTLEKCIRVQENDRLGVYLEKSPGAVSYIFDASHPTALNNRLENGTTSYEAGTDYKFDTLVFPYDFAVAAYIDVDPTHYANADAAADFVECFPGVLIPEYQDLGVLTTPAPTGAPGATGAEGPAGAQGPRGATGEVGATGPQGEIGATGERGESGVAGVNGTDGMDGTQGAAGGVGATGMQGVHGEKGEQGLVGPAGMPGQIFYVTNGSDPFLPQEKPSTIFTSDTMQMSYLIWLIILSLIIIILIIVITVMACRRGHDDGDSVEEFPRTRLPSEQSSRRRFPSLGSLPTSEMSQHPEQGWMDTMKDETETTYSNDTLQREQDFSNGSSMPNLSFENETKASELGY